VSRQHAVIPRRAVRIQLLWRISVVLMRRGVVYVFVFSFSFGCTLGYGLDVSGWVEWGLDTMGWEYWLSVCHIES